VDRGYCANNPTLYTIVDASIALKVAREDIHSKYQSEATGDCKTMSTSIWNVVDLGRRTISRCDVKGATRTRRNLRLQVLTSTYRSLSGVCLRSYPVTTLRFPKLPP
jgi:hypothetical protein